MINKSLISFVAALIGFMSIGIIQANESDYTPVPPDANTRVAYIGQIHAEQGTFSLDADFIDWYEGEAANEAFRRHEADSGMSEAPDGYYIVNEEIAMEKLAVKPDAKVFMQLYNRTGDLAEAETSWNEEIGLDRFLSLLEDGDGMNLRDYPYHLTIENGAVTKIVQQFIP